MNNYELYNDEVICYIALRHHTTPQSIIQYFIQQENGYTTITQHNNSDSLYLEDNEMEIIRSLLASYNKINN